MTVEQTTPEVDFSTSGDKLPQRSRPIHTEDRYGSNKSIENSFQKHIMYLDFGLYNHSAITD